MNRRCTTFIAPTRSIDRATSVSLRIANVSLSKGENTGNHFTIVIRRLHIAINRVSFIPQRSGERSSRVSRFAAYPITPIEKNRNPSALGRTDVIHARLSVEPAMHLVHSVSGKCSHLQRSTTSGGSPSPPSQTRYRDERTQYRGHSRG